MMRSLFMAALTAAMLSYQSAFAFTIRKTGLSSSTSATRLMATDTRRDFIGTTALSVAGLGIGVLAPPPANAVGGMDKVNAKLRA